MKKELLLIGIISLLLSCSSPMNKKFNEKTFKEDIEAIKNNIDSTELELLAGSMLRLKFKGEKIEEMTYSQILENGKKWKVEQDKIEAEQKALAEKAEKEQIEKYKRLNQAVVVSCFDKGYTKYNYEDYITYKFIIKNKSDKKIRAIKGNITFTNLFDDKINSLSFVYDKPIEAGEEVTYNAQTDYNQFKEEDKTLRNKDLKDLKVVWKPEKIIFDDGKILE
ncbi:hypothetical protein [Tenacibaculum finnmarkense]|uniref:hypothetical protein n=1 Tax=Tenacibaculum finnmarkense TaxID=2781243 RepID=UPI001E51F9CA|nr:hypothetical protein [Tenacibaculum finnmarkense]MCD8401422.1 hypothetical protein [Tenacibaculum finnmarkense genomovar ulcerans]